MRIAFLVLLAMGLAFAASDEADVLAVVEKTFRAMAAKDDVALRSTMLGDVRLYSVGEVGAPGVRSLDEFVKQIEGSKVELLERFTGKPQVMVRRRLAQVWGEYEFWRDGKFSHCGVDTVLLRKGAEGWKIATLSYTVEPVGCQGR